MNMSFWVRGVIIGFAIAAPVGPIGVLCIQRTLLFGRIIGFVTGLGAATADATYGALAAFGLSALSIALVGHSRWIHLLGGVFLCALGVKTLLSLPPTHPTQTVTPATKPGLLPTYLSTLALTLTNPLTILSFTAIYGGMGIADAHVNGVSAAILVTGVFCGSVVWWFLLSSAVSVVRAKLNKSALRWINWLSGACLLSFGMFALLSA